MDEVVAREAEDFPQPLGDADDLVAAPLDAHLSAYHLLGRRAVEEVVHDGTDFLLLAVQCIEGGGTLIHSALQVGIELNDFLIAFRPRYRFTANAEEKKR